MKDFSRENRNQMILDLKETATTLSNLAQEKAKNRELTLEEWMEINKAVSDLFTEIDKLTIGRLGEISKELNNSAKKIQAATTVANNALKTLSDIKKALKIAKAVVTLALAITARDLKGIGKSAKSIIDIVNKD